MSSGPRSPTSTAEDYDLLALAESSPDLSRFDDPRFEQIGARLAEHRADVCGS